MIYIVNVREEHTLKQKYSQFKNYYEQNYTGLPLVYFVSDDIELSYIAYFRSSPLMEREVIDI